MTNLRIAEVAERSGVPATTLRYYEEIGLLVPAGRRPNGYRAYSQRDVERLRFITRAKRLDLSLEDLRELVTAWDGQDCGDVQERMAQLVTTRLTQTQDRVADLMALAGQLQTAAARLAGPARPGRCDDACACSIAPEAGGPTFAPLTRAPITAHGTPPSSPPSTVPTAPGIPAAGGCCESLQSAAADVVIAATVLAPDDRTGQPVIACTLEADAVRERLGDWRSVLGRATSRGPIPGGVMATFDHADGLIADLARLAAAEQACCTFFDFTLTLTGSGIRFEVRAPSEAQDVLLALFGPPGAAA
jgi:DNA-binding transcriptional MerR regulator